MPPPVEPDPIPQATLRPVALQWLRALDKAGSAQWQSATAVALTAMATLLDRDRESQRLVLQEMSRDGLVATQGLGHEAFALLLRALFADRGQMARLPDVHAAMERALKHPPPGVRGSDVYQDLVLQLLRQATKWPDFRDAVGLDKYLMTILANLIRLRAGDPRNRQLGGDIAAEPMAALTGSEPAPVDAADQAEYDVAMSRARHFLEGSLARVRPPQFRAVLVLRLKHDWSFPELALVWPDDSEPASERQSLLTRARWLGREVDKFVRGFLDSSVGKFAIE